jgi:hypothetical protein
MPDQQATVFFCGPWAAERGAKSSRKDDGGGRARKIAGNAEGRFLRSGTDGDRGLERRMSDVGEECCPCVC